MIERRKKSMTDYRKIMNDLEAANAAHPKNKRKEPAMAKVTAVQILKEAAELKERKSKDYQGGMWSEEDYFPFGEQSYIHMIHTKYLRMRNIVEGNQETNFEALEDTLVDMAVYCAMFAAYLENKKHDTHL